MGDLATHLLSHTLDRVRADLALLESIGCISREDMHIITGRLPSSITAVQQEPEERYITPSSALTKGPPPAPPVRAAMPMAEAKWDYESPIYEQQDPADLTFKAGDKIEIVEETSEDWWLGRLNGRQGMFPSNRCVKVEPATSRSFPTHSASQTFSEKTGLNKFGLKPATIDQDKKDKFGKLKGTMANSAAGGLGFGAGAAIGGGLVRAIF
ncbi:SH3 domain-containing protein [Ceratobasidium sp. AG-Ba]|nr:SH3 domain-containing protein [Ceratobasidium sp. AG-Ba]